jgi:hypothetical protein
LLGNASERFRDVERPKARPPTREEDGVLSAPAAKIEHRLAVDVTQEVMSVLEGIRRIRGWRVVALDAIRRQAQIGPDERAGFFPAARNLGTFPCREIRSLSSSAHSAAIAHARDSPVPM